MKPPKAPAIDPELLKALCPGRRLPLHEWLGREWHVEILSKDYYSVPREE